MSDQDTTRAVARLLLISGIIGAVVLPVVSWPAGVMCAVVAALGWYILHRGRPSSRWARGWSAFRQRR